MIQDLKKILKNPEHSFVDIGKYETCMKNYAETMSFHKISTPGN